MQKNDPLITQGRGWKKCKHLDYSISYTGDVSLKNIIKLLEVLTNTIDDDKIKVIKLYIDKIKGNFAFIIDKKIESKIIIDLVNKAENKLIREVNIFDVYEGEEIPEGKKSIAISIVLQPEEKTLKDAEIESICKNIISAVIDNTGAVLREK